MRRIKHREFGLLAGVAVTVLALGLIVARDLRRTAEDAGQLHDRLLRGIDLIDALQFNAQEVRRIILYALHTSDANRQLDYAEQSRSADVQVQKLLDDRAAFGSQPDVLQIVQAVDGAWQRYLVVRDEVIGLILEGSLPEGVALDEKEGLARFNDVRRTIGELKASFTSDAEARVRAAKARADDATVRLTILVLSALAGAALGIYLVNRRTALEGLLLSEAHKGSILQAVPDPVISTDAAGGIIEVNAAVERVFGFSRREALGASVEDLVLPLRRRGELLAAVIDATLAGPRAAVPRFETLGLRKDGSEFPIEIAAVAHWAGSERIFTIHVSDMTERRRSEQKLRDAKEVAEIAARGQSEFLTTMSHELRTPLNGVIGIADLLQHADLPASQRELVGMLRSSATALMGLVGDVLDYSRIDQGLMDLTPEEFSVRDCIEDALDTVAQSAARKGLEVGYLIDAGVPATVRADQHRVRQVLLNLLSNAVKFTDAGEVTVRASAQRTAGDGVAMTINVRDTGHGIPEHLHHKLFERFTQIDATRTRQHGGAGLGLAISKRLSALLGGSLDVISREDAGATFRFTFQATVVPGASTDVFAGSLSGLNVLTLVGPGIVGEHVRALLSSWEVRFINGWDGTTPLGLPQGELDAVVVDADADDGRLLTLARDCRARWGEELRLVVIARPVSGWSDRSEAHECGVGKPVNARRLHEALCPAVRATHAASVRSTVPQRIAPFAPASLAILVADDNAANRRVLQLMLAELGLVADEVGNGADAVDRALTREYDVILMDIQMPILDGLEATRRIRAQLSRTRPRIVALTANVMPQEEARCREAGMDEYLPRPLRFDTLAAALQRLVPGPRT